MKNRIIIALFATILFACNNEPKLNKTEETAVESKLSSDLQAMDSLENAIKAQMDALDADSAQADSM